MNLYIRIKDGQPFEHPILEENLLEAFPNIDLNNLPEDITRFEKTNRPNPGVYEKMLDVIYIIDNDVVREQWTVVPFTEEEKQSKIYLNKYMRPHFPSWTFDEDLCDWIPPVSKPTEGIYIWDERVQNWVERPI